MALSNKAKSSLLDLLFNTAKVAIRAKSAPQTPPEQTPSAKPAQNQNLAGCCDKKKVK
jgi:hypothetical protein